MKVSPVVVALVLSLGMWSAALVAQQTEPAPTPPASPVSQKSPDAPPAADQAAAHPPVIANPAVTLYSDARWNVAVDVQMIALPQELALVFIADLQSEEESKVEAAVGQLQDLLKKKQAILLGWPRAIGADGVRVTTETVVEQRYATEFDAERLAPDAPTTPPAPKSESHMSPTAFETRNMGPSLEVESNVLNEGRDIVLLLSVQRVSLLEFERFNVGRSKEGEAVHVEQPQFASSRITTTLKVHNGQHVLLGTHLLTKPENHIEFFIARALTTKMR